MLLLLMGCLGFCNGLRTMMPLAVLCWVVSLHRLPMVGWRGLVGHGLLVGFFTLAALAELVADKLPQTPNRTAAVGLIARIVFAGSVAGLLAPTFALPSVLAVLVGVIGAVLGTYIGWFVRTRTVRLLRCPDWMIAVTEDAICIAGSGALLWMMAAHAGV